MASAIETPWHGLGNIVDPNLTPEEMAQAAGINWAVEKRPLFMASNANGMSQIPSHQGLVRVSDNSVLSVVTNRYVPIQNSDVMNFFKKFTEAGHMTMETAGSLMAGKFIWGLARINREFAIGDDINRGYLLLCNPHVPGYAMTADFTSVRVVCMNTLTMALSNLSQRAFKMAHLREFNGEATAAAEQALGMAVDANARLADQALVLAQHNVPSTEALTEYLTKVFKLTPTQLTVRQVADEAVGAEESETTEEAVVTTTRAPRQSTLVTKSLQAFETAPGSELPSSRGTWWGAVNAVTYVLDHQVGRSQDNRIYQAWLGERAKTKQKALNLALELAV
jgi:phage/plasmid-like protein (TIGR03299 family)